MYVNDEYYDLIPEPCEDEEDMLDMAFALRDTCVACMGLCRVAPLILCPRVQLTAWMLH